MGPKWAASERKIAASGANLRMRRDACPMPRDSMGHRAAQRAYPEGGYVP